MKKLKKLIAFCCALSIVFTFSLHAMEKSEVEKLGKALNALIEAEKHLRQCDICKQAGAELCNFEIRYNGWLHKECFKLLRACECAMPHKNECKLQAKL